MRDVLVKVNLEFEKENKDKIYKILEKKEWLSNLITESDDWVGMEFYEGILEEDIEEIKYLCEHIGIDEYEYCEGDGLYWDNEDTDLQKIVRQKMVEKNENQRKNIK